MCLLASVKLKAEWANTHILIYAQMRNYEIELDLDRMVTNWVLIKELWWKLQWKTWPNGVLTAICLGSSMHWLIGGIFQGKPELEETSHCSVFFVHFSGTPYLPVQVKLS